MPKNLPQDVDDAPVLRRLFFSLLGAGEAAPPSLYPVFAHVMAEVSPDGRLAKRPARAERIGRATGDGRAGGQPERSGLIKPLYESCLRQGLLSASVWRRSHKPGMDVYANNRGGGASPAVVVPLSASPPQRASPEGSLSPLKAPSVIPNIAVSSLEIIASSRRFDSACGAGKMHSVQMKCLHMSSNSINKKKY